MKPNSVACMPCSCVTGCGCSVSSSIDIRTQFWRRALQRGTCMGLQCVFVCEGAAERVLRSCECLLQILQGLVAFEQVESKQRTSGPNIGC